MQRLIFQERNFATKQKDTEDRHKQYQEQAKECENLYLSKIGALSTHLRESSNILKGLEVGNNVYYH